MDFSAIESFIDWLILDFVFSFCMGWYITYRSWNHVAQVYQYPLPYIIPSPIANNVMYQRPQMQQWNPIMGNQYPSIPQQYMQQQMNNEVMPQYNPSYYRYQNYSPYNYNSYNQYPNAQPSILSEITGGVL